MKNRGRFLHTIGDAYRQIFFEQQVPVDPLAATTAAPAPPPLGVPPMAAVPGTGETQSDVEKSPENLDAVTPESEAMLTGLLAKSFFIDLMDESEKLKVINMQANLQANLTDETANKVELAIVKRIKSEDSKILDMDDGKLFELSPKGARIFLNTIANPETIEGLTIKPGKGKTYLLNLILTVLLRHFELGEAARIRKILEDIRDQTTQGPTLEESDSKTINLLIKTLSKYAKV
jgi:hypothetical protein